MCYGLIGKPLKHSFSKKFFSDFFQEKGITASYELFELETISELPRLLDEQSLLGLNVTSPYKEQVLAYVDELSPEVQVLQASNVLKLFRREDRLVLKAYNTDVLGFKTSLEHILQTKDKLKENKDDNEASSIVSTALILGTGGAARAVAYALRQMDIKPIYVSRQGSGSVADLQAEERISYSDLDHEIERAELIINASPIGLNPKECPNIPYEKLTPKHIVYDLIYNPQETLFLKKAKEQGAFIKNGLEMLQEQALEAWKIWSKSTD